MAQSLGQDRTDRGCDFGFDEPHTSQNVRCMCHRIARIRRYRVDGTQIVVLLMVTISAQYSFKHTPFPLS